MKYLVFVFMLAILCGCTDFKKTEVRIIINDHNMRQFSDQCEKLAKCLKAEGEIVHFSNQPHEPYACSIVKNGKTRKKTIYFYPKAECWFDEWEFDGLGNEIKSCEMVTETGEQSDEEYARMDEMFKEMDKQKKRREQADIEWQKDQTKTVKVKEIK